MLQELNFILLHVPDLDQALPFYTEKLGFAIDGQAPGFVQFKRPTGGGAIFALSQEAGTPTNAIELWWTVENADAVFAELSARGVEIADQLKDQPFGRTFSIKDPAGNTLSMFQPRQ